MAVSPSPFSLLLSYQQRALAVRAGIPLINVDREVWLGLAFRLGQQILLAPMAEIEEVVDMPLCASLPNTKPWFLGVSNVRGNLVAVSDLHAFVFHTARSDKRESRMLISRSGDSTVGIVVDEILGLRRFFIDEQLPYQGDIVNILRPFVVYAFERERQIYPLFQLHQFVTSSDFLRVEKE